MTLQESLNRSTWSRPEVGQYFASLSTYTDPGERAAFERVREQVRNQPILDLGIGAGRTIALLRQISEDYLGIDYLPAMVELARENHPGVKIQLGDARTLEGIANNHFGLTCFSFNGIDAVSHTDRALVFKAVHRVLKPGGVFFFSSLNLNGPEASDRPWKLYVGRTRNPVRWLARVARKLAFFPLDVRNWIRIRDAGEQGDGYAIAALSAHHFRVLAHFTTVGRQLAELKANGFEQIEVYDSLRGELVTETTDTRQIGWFHFIAHK